MCITTRFSSAVLTLALLLTAPASAQILWQRVLGTADNSENSAVTLAVPGGYVQVGVQLRYPEPQQLFLTHLHEDGTVRWQRQQVLPGLLGLYARAAVVDAAGQLYVSVIGFRDEKSSSGMLVKFTPEGDTLWTRRVLGVELDKASLDAMVLAADGGVVVLGRENVIDFAAKYSPDGQLLWRRSYGTSGEDSGYLSHIAPVPTGFLVIQSPAAGGGRQYLLLDEQGQLVGKKPGPTYVPYSIRPDQAGNLLSADGALTKVSPTGEALWTRHYPLNVRFAAETPGGGRYLLAGTQGPFQTEDLALVLIDAAGTVLRDTVFYRPFAHEQPTGIAFDAQGNYVVGGYATQGPIGGEDQFILKLRSWDRLLPTARTRMADLVRVPAYRLYPNPVMASDERRVSAGSRAAFSGGYEFRDAVGQVLRAGRLAPGQPLPVTGLPPGLYLVRLHDGRRWLPALHLNRL